jgi:hypothetical protein
MMARGDTTLQYLVAKVRDAKDRSGEAMCELDKSESERARETKETVANTKSEKSSKAKRGKLVEIS